MNNTTTLAPRSQAAAHDKPKSLVTKFANKFGVDGDKMLTTLKATAFKTNGDISNEQMMALLVVADQYNLNPFTKEIYAFPDKKGIIPIVGVDGWARMINENIAFDGVDFNESESRITLKNAKECPEWIECVVYRKDRNNPVKIKEYLDEVYVEPRNGYNGPWQSHTKRMLRHKTMIQACRIAFGFTGIYDEDEANRIMEQREAIDITPKTEAPTNQQQSRSDSIAEKLASQNKSTDVDHDISESLAPSDDSLPEE